MLNRRKLLFSGLGVAAAGAVYALDRAEHTLPPADPAAEERFRRLQDLLLTSAAVPATSRFADLPEPRVRTHIIEAGAGEPVLLIHGGNSVAASWVPLLARLHPRFHLYAPDRPGCGLTTKFNYEGVPLRAHAVAFIRSVMDALGLERASLVGNSMGGYFTLAFALAHPERVSKMVLVGEPAGSAPHIRADYQVIGTRVINSALYATVLKPRPNAQRAAFASRLVADVNRVPPDYLMCMDAAAMIPGAVESWITMIERAFPYPGAAFLSSDSQLTYALRPELGVLSVPTLFLWGDKDTFGPAELGQEMARLMPNARCEVVPDAGHLVWMDQLDRCADRITSFLS